MSNEPSTLSDRLLAVSVCALLGWSAWARGGTVATLQSPLPWIGLGILAILAFDRLDHVKTEPKAQRSWREDTVFWTGLVFLVLLLAQWGNAGRHPYFHPFDQQWVFTPPPNPGWPWAVDRNDAAEMLRWFFPAWALMLAFRHARRSAWLATRVAWFLVINAGLLAAFGIAQALSGTQHIFWITPLPSHFFASFGYENHAASYFALLFALAVGMLLQRLTAGQKSEVGNRRSEVNASANRRASIVTAAICAVLCLVGMALSFSRTGLALAVGLPGVALLVAARLFWPRATIAQRVAGVAGLIMGLATVFFVVVSMGGDRLAKESSGLYRINLARELDVRLFMVRSAAQMWMVNPWFGVGGWGFRHFVPVYALENAGTTLGMGYANTHNDAMQFLCEFGAVGVGLMTSATLAFAWPLLRRVRGDLTPGLALASAGLLAVVFHSLIDLPFRSPGILYAWLGVCGVAAQEDGFGKPNELT